MERQRSKHRKAFIDSLYQAITAPVPELDYRIIGGLCLITTIVILPFLVDDVARGDWRQFTIGGILMSMCAGFAAHTLYRRRVHPLLPWIIVIAADVAGGLTILHLKGNAIFFIYPLVAASFFLLPMRAAICINLVMFAMVLPGVHQWASTSQLPRIYGSLIMLFLFSFVFSYVVQQQRKALEKLACIDPLTGAGNRRELLAALTAELELRKRYDTLVSLIMFDVDHFKHINDSHGHAVGDKVLQELVATARKRMRASDRIFRYGGEEFVLLAPQTDLKGAAALAEDLRKEIAESHVAELPKVTISVGVAELGQREESDAWLKRSDEALYRAKQGGRNRVEVAGPLLVPQERRAHA